MSQKERDEGRRILEEKFKAKISPSNHKFYRMQPVYNYDRYKSPGLADYESSYQEVVVGVDITLEEASFEYLCSCLSYQQSGRDRFKPYDHEMWDRLQSERDLRARHPGLQKAYDKYRILLDLVANGKEIE